MLSTINLNFLIISHNQYYEELFHNIKTHYHINICTHSHPTSQQLEEADIVICESPLDFKPDDKSHLLAMVLVLPHDKTENIDLQYYTHVWLSPITQSLLEFNYLQLINQVAEKKNSEVNEVYLDTLINSIPDLVWFKDLRGSHLKVNNAFGNAVGKTVEECTGRGHYYIWDLEPDEYADGEYVCLETEDEVIRKGETCLFDEKVKSKSGLRQFKTYKSPLYDFDGKMFGTVGIAKDVTDLHNISRELEIVLSSIPFATVLADDSANIVYANTSFYETFNIVDDNKPLNYEEFCINTLKSSIEQLNQDKIFTVRNHQNELNYLRIQQQSLEDIFGNHFGYFLICIDITREHELQRKILHHANTDFLTGLYNRRYFYETAYQLNIKSKIAFIYFDLDNFKAVNDSYGHQMGDEVLKLMARLLKENFADDLIIRLGGDEFLVAKTTDENIQAIKQEVEEFIKKSKQSFHDSKEFQVISLSAGIAYGDADFDIDQLLLEADDALYQAKTSGKSKVCISNK